jgi:signal transduction histidine kinase
MLGADRADRGETDETRLKRSLRDWLVDVVMFIGAVVIGTAGVQSDHRTASTGLLIVDIVIGVIAVAALWQRRRYPFAVGLVAILASAVSGAAGGAAIAALFTGAVYCPPRRSVPLFGLLVVASAVYPVLYPGSATAGYNLGAFVTGELAVIVAAVFGAFVRARRELVLSLHERARQLQDEQQLHITEARRAERTRIAREMHDVLAHRISLLAVHAGALEFHPDASPAEIARAATVIRESARAAQEELREVIGLLRSEPVAPAAVGRVPDGTPSAADALQPPQPTLDDLGTLVAESRQAGMDVRLATALDPATLAPTLGRTVYRIVQEGLTNARKHAPDHVVAIVVVGGRRDGVRISVTNQPQVGQSRMTAETTHVGSGTGLIGLGERVALAGGRLEHEVLAGGGFRLSATLPWPSEMVR